MNKKYFNKYSEKRRMMTVKKKSMDDFTIAYLFCLAVCIYMII